MTKANGPMISRRAALGGMGLGTAAVLANGAVSATAPVDKVTIYHVEGRRSHRIIWFCEEAGIPYEALYIRGDLLGSINAIKAINPDMPTAPTVVFRGEMLVESAGIIEYLMTQFASSAALAPGTNSPDFAKYKMWMHFAEGSAMPRISGDIAKLAKTGGPLEPVKIGPLQMVGSMDVIKFMDKFLGTRPYFGGSQFSAADIMYDIVMTLIGNLPVPESDYPNLVAWHARVMARPAYKKAMQVGNPDGVSLKVNIPKSAVEAPAAGVAGQYSVAATPIGTLLADPAAKALVDRHFPDFTKSPSVASGMANSMTMKSLQTFRPDEFTDATLRALDADLAKLPAQ